MFKRPYILVIITLSPLAVSGLFLYLSLSSVLRRELVSWEAEVRQIQMAQIVDELKVRIDAAWDVANHYYDEGLGQDACTKAIASISQNQDSYVFVMRIDRTDRANEVMVVHPDKSFVGQSAHRVVDLERIQEIYYRGEIYPLGHPAVAGIQSVNVGEEISDICVEQGSGMIQYYWPRVVDGKASQVGYPKVTYVRFFPPWNWAMGSGAYADHIEGLVAAQVETARANMHHIMGLLLWFTLVITLVMAVIATGVSHRFSRKLIRYENSLLESGRRLRQEVEKSRRSEQIFKTLITNLPQKVVLKDRDSRILYCNEKYAESLHRTVEQIIGRNEYDLYPREVADRYVTSDRSVIEHGETIEVLSRRPVDGQERVTRVLKTPVKDDYQQADGILCVFEDFTERIQNEERLRAANAEMEETNRRLRETQRYLVQSEKMASIGQLAAGIAHEINNPMCYVVGNSHALQEYVTSLIEFLGVYDRHIQEMAQTGNALFEEHARAIQDIRSELDIDHICTDVESLLDDSQEGMNRVLRIVRNLRTFSRIDQVHDVASFNLNEGIRSTLAIANNELTEKSCVTTDLGDIPEVRCNSGEINQVILNILVNAAQAIGLQQRNTTGNIMIRTYREGDDVVCTIADDGPGIPTENLNRVFDPFFTTKPVGQGTGLGLHISYDIIVRQHGGHLSVESEAGKGTTFTIKIPIHGKPHTGSAKGRIHERENSAVC
ncbi:MAG: PAS domain-containing protein [Phycisphaerae bacterium]|nr:PAS domain-containing protein [Phycisphaerae bacterium]